MSNVQNRCAHWNRVSSAAIAAAICSFVVAGCDLTGQYDKKFAAALEDARRRSAFDDLLHASIIDITDAARTPTGARLRLPKKFDGESKASAKNSIPGQAEVKGTPYELSRELDDDSGQKAPCIVSLRAVPKPDAKADPKAESLQAQITRSMAASAGGKWEDVTVSTPAGQSLSLKRIRSEISMPVAGAKGGATNVPTRLDVYYADAGNNEVVIYWLTPKPQAQKHALEPAIEASMGTLELPGAGEAGGAASKTGCF